MAILLKVFKLTPTGIIFLWHIYLRDEMGLSLVGKFLYNTILYKALPIWHSFASNMVLCYALWKTTLHVAKCPSPFPPITQFNFNLTSVLCWKKEDILYRIYVAYNYKTNILCHILNRQNFEILFANYTP